MITIARSAIKQDVKINPAKWGNVNPMVVLEKTGFRIVMIFAATVIINQFTGHKK